MILKNRTISITADNWGHLGVSVFKKGKSGRLESEGWYKFDGNLEGVDLEVLIPKGCRTEYAKIIKIK